MKKVLLAVALAASLSACSFDQASTQSASVAVSKATIAANDLYKRASRAGEDLVNLGQLDKAKYKAADARAYAILIQFRAGTATAAQLTAAIAAITGDAK